MILLSVKRLFKITGKQSGEESIFSKVTEISCQHYYQYQHQRQYQFRKVTVLETSRSCPLTSIKGFQSTGCKATAIELRTKLLEWIWKILRNSQQLPGLQTQTSMFFKFRKISETSAVEFDFTKTFHFIIKTLFTVGT